MGPTFRFLKPGSLLNQIWFCATADSHSRSGGFARVRKGVEGLRCAEHAGVHDTLMKGVLADSAHNRVHHQIIVLALSSEVRGRGECTHAFQEIFQRGRRFREEERDCKPHLVVGRPKPVALPQAVGVAFSPG